MDFIMQNLSIILSVGIPVAFVIAMLCMGYVKSPPDTAIIISGFRKKPKILIGRAGIKLPFFERKDTLSLKQITIDVKTGEYIPTLDYINIQVDAVVKVKISTEDHMMSLAMKNFLNKQASDIVFDLQDSLQGNMREIIGTLSLRDICNNRDEFGNQVQTKAKVDMEKLGIEIISCNIQSIADKNGLIEDMGMDNTSKIKKDASIAKAQAERDIQIAEAQAKKEANDARVKSETDIAMQNNNLEIKRSELKIISDAKKAEADAAYEIQNQEQRKAIEISKANADIAKEEKLVEVKRTQAEVQEQALDAEIRKKADAEKYAEEQKAQVELFKRKKEAEARKYEAEQEAEALRKKAEAEKYASEQKALGIKAVGEAEAAALEAKGVAEAVGIEKKAEAMKKMGEASVLEMFFKAYPDVMAAAAKPLDNVNSITMFGDGNSSKMVEDIVKSTSQVMSGIEASTGINVQALLSGFLGSKLNNSNNSSQSNNSDENYEDISE